MLRSRVVHLGALALVAVAASAVAALHNPLLAQGSTMRLAFGYQCGDNFVVHNDGMQPVDIQYAVAGSADRAPLHLGGGESLTITSPANAPLELWVNGKRVASEAKGNRACPAGTDGNVVVRSLDGQPPMADSAAAANAAASAVPIYDGPAYYPPYPYPYYYPYAYYGYYPYPYVGPLVSIRAGPVFGGRGIIGGRGFIGGRGRIR